MLEFSELDFLLFSAIFFLLGIGTGLSICCMNKETFLQRVKSREDCREIPYQANQVIEASALPKQTQQVLEVKDR